MLFETLAHCRDLWTIGDESHAIFESIPELQIGNKLTSNRLTEDNLSPSIRDRIITNFRHHLQNRDGQVLAADSCTPSVRLLEKTPKNALRIPFLNALFPDAMFIYLFRDPYENISSIMEAWRSNRWVTYNELPGWNGNWSLLLPPGWQKLKGKSLEEIAAFQWREANQYILNDLAKLPRERWSTISYRQLVTAPGVEIQRLCSFIGTDFDAHLEAFTNGTLPLSRYTQTPPAAGKWKKNEPEIRRLMTSLQGVIRKIDEIDNQDGTDKHESWFANRTLEKPARNAPCPCGSGKKFKRCHGSHD